MFLFLLFVIIISFKVVKMSLSFCSIEAEGNNGSLKHALIIPELAFQVSNTFQGLRCLECCIWER